MHCHALSKTTKLTTKCYAYFLSEFCYVVFILLLYQGIILKLKRKVH